MKETLEVLNQVNEFYNSAWEKLILVATVSFGIVGVLVPLLIQWYQKKSMNLNEEKLQKYITDEIERNKVSLHEEMKAILIEEIQSFEEKIIKIQNKSEGGIFHIQGNNMVEIKDFKSAIHSYGLSIEYYFAARDYKNLKTVLDAVNETCIERINKVDIQELKDEESLDFEKSFSQIIEDPNAGSLTALIKAMRKKINQLK